MKSFLLVTAVASLALLAACGGQTQQQADTPQPASSETPQQSSSTGPTPESQPAAPPSTTHSPAQQRPAHSTTASTARPTPPAPAKPAVHMVTVPAGTVLMLALDNGLSSKTAQVGDGFTATVVHPIEAQGSEVIPAGAKIEGRVTEAVPAKQGAGKGKLAMSFDVLTMPDGYRTNIVGMFQELSESKKKRNAMVIGGSAAGGALLGRILGKDTKGAVVGAIVGGGIGTAVVMGQEGEQAKLPADTPFEIKLEEPIQVPHSPTTS